MSPGEYVKSAMVTVSTAGPFGSDVMSTKSSVASPPWLSFSGRWPWVRGPSALTLVWNGSAPSVPSASHITMIPIDSYHDARPLS